MVASSATAMHTLTLCEGIQGCLSTVNKSKMSLKYWKKVVIPVLEFVR